MINYSTNLISSIIFLLVGIKITKAVILINKEAENETNEMTSSIETLKLT